MAGWWEMQECCFCNGVSFVFLSYLQGVCLGMQLAVVEFSRNVLGWQGKHLLKNLLNSCFNVLEGVKPGAHWEIESHAEDQARSLRTLWGSDGELLCLLRESRAPPGETQKEGNTTEQAAWALCPCISCSADSCTLVTMATVPELVSSEKTLACVRLCSYYDFGL